jgi:hypothetical protein
MLQAINYFRNPAFPIEITQGIAAAVTGALGAHFVEWLNPGWYPKKASNCDLAALCNRPIAEDAFYNKNVCVLHSVFSEEKYRDARLVELNPELGAAREAYSLMDKMFNEKWKKLDRESSVAGVSRASVMSEFWKEWAKEMDKWQRITYSGPAVFAKLENTERCTLDGHEEQVVVMCNEEGRTNSTSMKEYRAETRALWSNAYSKAYSCRSKYRCYDGLGDIFDSRNDRPSVQTENLHQKLWLCPDFCV